MSAETIGSTAADADAAPLDLLLTDAALGALNRVNPGGSGLRLAAALAARPRLVASRTRNLLGELTRIAAGASQIEPSRRDRRFADPGWAGNPLLRRVLQGYLAAAQTAEGLAQDALRPQAVHRRAVDAFHHGPETSARPDGGGWVLNGAKRWIGLGSVADLVVVWAHNTEDGQVNAFVVKKGSSGYSAQVIDGKVSLRSVWQADITLDNVRVPAENRLPEARSFQDTSWVLTTTAPSHRRG